MASALPLRVHRAAPARLPKLHPVEFGVAAAGLATAAAGTLLLGGGLPFAAALGGIAFGGGAVALLRRARVAGDEATAPVDTALVRALAADCRDASALTDRAGRVVLTSPMYDGWFGAGCHPRAIEWEGNGAGLLAEAQRAAWRDGEATLAGLDREGRFYAAFLRRAGQAADHLVWRFRVADVTETLGTVRALVSGRGGLRLGTAGVMAVLADPTGNILVANPAFVARALGDAERDPAGRALVDLLQTDGEGTIRIAREALAALPEGEAPVIRIVTIVLDEPGQSVGDAPTLFLLLDEDPEVMSAAAARGAATGHLHALLAMLPLGLALTERDGRFLFANAAFERGAGIAAADQVLYPSDLVIEEDKAAVADAIRRFAAGRALPGDLAIRLKHRPEEPVALTIANAKGLGEAAVLLSLKDDTEESKLKRQIAQATKMQAVGQLAGGVAHDFNNILTAIIGHCDLMGMRHVPGDIDYDDIQQIKHNSNRAAALTRQLLAFSRQQTLRPQVLQLPEVIAEVSNLLRRLLGERIKLDVKHGRDLGLVRADPGQLEQVIVNLAVNARDAMPDGGRLTLQTYNLPAGEVRRMRSDIMPIADYTALKVSDTGSGIPADILGKIFEPFFTTKEVGKGTGLGLSTVYGIVKQTDGFIFADSEIGHGTSFVIYLPVHHAPAPSEVQVPVRAESGAAAEMWGTGTILLVEDEAMVRAVAERALVRQGYTVLAAASGEEALDLLESEDKIDLLISDVVMPGMDGPALVRRVRQDYPQLPVLFMSGYAEEQLRKSIDIEQVAFLSKPFSVQQLALAARDAMAAQAA